ncbi:MAG: C39 family peptidase [Desulfitobacteriaceae bacterium]|nr:C39 family peptidase [Desulfitobacteriaceae bacterium]
MKIFKKGLSTCLIALCLVFVFASSTYAYEYLYDRVLNVPTYKQEKSYWCGPACLQMVIKYVTGSKISQETLATEAGTTSTKGTYVYKMAETLRAHSVNSKYYSVYDVDFDTTFRSSLDKDIPAIAHLCTRYLPAYNGKNYGHYVVLRGRYIYINDPGIEPQSVEETCGVVMTQPLAERIYISELYYTDPYDGLTGVYGRHIVSPSVMLQAIKDNAGYFIASK